MRKIFFLLPVTLLLIPILSFIFWLFSPQTKLNIVILDKTVLDNKCSEHASFNWLLNYKKIVKQNGSPYIAEEDYFGFFPSGNYQYLIKDFESFTGPQIDSLTHGADLLYITDTYGIYGNEWYGEETGERSKIIYGGTTQREIDLMKRMLERDKVVITEFNMMASPTPLNIRNQFEQISGIKWTGWIGRYFDLLDTLTNKEIPKWAIRNYLHQHQSWPFKKSGIVLVNENDFIVVLEEGRELKDGLPYIITESKKRNEFALPQKIKYPFWFDIIEPINPHNTIISTYQLSLTSLGDSLLLYNGIPLSFPAVISNENSSFFYFAGDFSDNPVSHFHSHFAGIFFMRKLMYSHNKPSERNSFFWEYYIPLTSTLLNRLQN